MVTALEESKKVNKKTKAMHMGPADRHAERLILL